MLLLPDCASNSARKNSSNLLQPSLRELSEQIQHGLCDRVWGIVRPTLGRESGRGSYAAPSLELGEGAVRADECLPPTPQL